MTPLEHEIHTIIRRDGPISVADYMALALGHPEHGYYRTRDPFGVHGDFTTAPEISQVFGELLGLWCAVTWRQMGAPDPVRLVELGPGRGTLMADALRAAATVPEFHAAADIHLVETSPTLRKSQRKTLAAVDLTWHDTLDGVPCGPMLVLANEFFDALPVQQFVRHGGAWRRRHIDIDSEGGRLCFVLSDHI
ncbi:MAG: class I SAM-dependent methyltransferase, partial [Alphaproteobacteria bacterium]